MLVPELQLRIYIKATFWLIIIEAALRLCRMLQGWHQTYQKMKEFHESEEESGCLKNVSYRECLKCGLVLPEFEFDQIEPEVYSCHYCHGKTKIYDCDEA